MDKREINLLNLLYKIGFIRGSGNDRNAYTYTLYDIETNDKYRYIVELYVNGIHVIKNDTYTIYSNDPFTFHEECEKYLWKEFTPLLRRRKINNLFNGEAEIT